jgi:preprotein translocase subunit SecA
VNVGEESDSIEIVAHSTVRKWSMRMIAQQTHDEKERKERVGLKEYRQTFATDTNGKGGNRAGTARVMQM